MYHTYDSFLFDQVSLQDILGQEQTTAGDSNHHHRSAEPLPSGTANIDRIACIMHNVRMDEKLAKLYYPVSEKAIAPESSVDDASDDMEYNAKVFFDNGREDSDTVSSGQDDEIFERDVLNLIEDRK